MKTEPTIVQVVITDVYEIDRAEFVKWLPVDDPDSLYRLDEFDRVVAGADLSEFPELAELLGYIGRHVTDRETETIAVRRESPPSLLSEDISAVSQ